MVDAPPGYQLGGGIIPANLDQLTVTLTVPENPPSTPVSLVLEGESLVNGRPIRRRALSAENMMQAFAYYHVVPQQEWLVATLGDAVSGPGVLSPSEPVKIKVGGWVELHLAAARPDVLKRTRLALSDAPDGISLGRISYDAEGLIVELRADAKKAPVGLRGNVIIAATFYPPAPPRPPGATGKPPPGPRPISLGVLPAIPFEVVAAQ
jgi:hypothetical protein